MSEQPRWKPEAGEGAQSAAEWANQVGFHETHAKKRTEQPNPAAQAAAMRGGQAAGQQYPNVPYARQQAGAWNQPYPNTSAGLPGGVPVPYQMGGPVVPQKSKVTAGVLGILLGGLGVHKFYMGYTAQGLILLAATLITFGVLAPVTSIIGLIEGILYLTKSDADFFRTYEQGHHPWF